eukprot:826839-Pyramimonas_sp.AAC.1
MSDIDGASPVNEGDDARGADIDGPRPPSESSPRATRVWPTDMFPDRGQPRMPLGGRRGHTWGGHCATTTSLDSSSDIGHSSRRSMTIRMS